MVVWLHGRMEKDGDKEDEGTGGGHEAKGKEMKHGEERQFNPNSHQGTAQTTEAAKQR